MKARAGSLLSCVALSCLLAGCLSPLRYTQDHRPFVALGGDRFLVRRFGTDIPAAKLGTLKDVAALCLNQGFRYFLIEDEQVISNFRPAYVSPGRESWESWDRSADPAEQGSGVQKGWDAGYRYTAHFFKARPNSLAKDAQEYLESLEAKSGPAPDPGRH